MSDKDSKLNSTSFRGSKTLAAVAATHPGGAAAGNDAEVHPVTGHGREGGWDAGQAPVSERSGHEG